MIKAAINKLSDNKNLDSIETREAFDEIISGLADDTLISSFVTALYSKGCTSDELAGAILSCRESGKKIGITIDGENTIENNFIDVPEGIFDINLAVDIVCSACGLGALRYSFDSVFFYSTVFKRAEYLKIPIFSDNNLFADFFEKNLIGYFAGSVQEPFFKYTSEIMRKLPFETIFKFISYMLNPYNSKNQLVGLNSKEQVEKVAQVCLKLNNLNSIVLSGDNCPFVCGETFVAEAWKNKIFTYNFSPDLVGLKKYTIDDLKVENDEHNTQVMLEVFNNERKDAFLDFIIVNSALSLYIAKKANSIMDAIKLAQQAINDGLIANKLKTFNVVK